VISALGVSGMENIFPPFFILPRTSFRGHFWNDALAFSGDDANPNGWIKEEFFFYFCEFFLLM
jgi:hypothetical protein